LDTALFFSKNALISSSTLSFKTSLVGPRFAEPDVASISFPSAEIL